MPIRYFTEVRKARRRSKLSPPVSASQVEKLGKRMEQVFQVSFTDGVKRLRANVDTKVAEKYFRKKDYKGMTDSIKWDDLGNYFQGAIDALNKTVQGTAKIVQKDLPTSIKKDLRLDAKNDAISDYLNIRTGMLIQNVSEPAQVGVQAAVRRAFQDGVAPRDVAVNVAKTLKETIGLTEQQQMQYISFQGGEKEKAELYDRLLNYRAMMISRTEISFAQNQGQLAVWKAGQDQGLIDDTATKVWIVDGSPCPKICDPMDGKEVLVSEEFELPDGVTVPSPPAHPHCRCLMSLNVGDKPNSNRQNYKDGADQADDGSSSGRGNDGRNNEGGQYESEELDGDED